MVRSWFKLRYGLLAAPVVLGAAGLWVWAQEPGQPAATPAPVQPAPAVTPAPALGQPVPVAETPEASAPAPVTPPPVPLPATPAPLTAEAPAPDDAQKGVEVLTRGPIHEAFASLAADPQ